MLNRVKNLMSWYHNEEEAVPTFKVGDEVEFEKSTYQPSALPRWDEHNEDMGSSGIWIRGKVKRVSKVYIEIEYEFEDYIGKGQANFPYIDHYKYSSHQWKRRGYLMKIGGEIKCVCGGATVFGKGTNLHSFWCDKSDV